MVEDSSSYLGPPVAETIQHISDNHMDMCRFHGLDDPGYVKVAAAFQRISATNDTSTGTMLQAIPTIRVSSDTLALKSNLEGVMDLQSGAEEEAERKRLEVIKELDAKRRMIDLLKFDELGARMHDIQPAQMQTCEWFLTTPEYTGWRDGNHGLSESGFLWIKGKPGTGKSTLMKYLYSIHSRQPGRAVISFFFNARGAMLERSTLGCYRTLLFLLLDGRQELWEVLDHLDKMGRSYIKSNGWNIALLTETFQKAVQILAKEQPVECWIDALDECQDSEVEQMVSFFEDLDEFMLSSELPFRVCFASRHYPTIVPKKAIQLVLEKQERHENDISKYIAAKLRMGNSIHQSEVESKLLGMSSGIFLWVVLVIPILNREYSKGKISALRKRLDEIPPGLDALFHSILARDNDDMQELLGCLQWILCSIRPLKPLELYTAMQPSANSYVSETYQKADPFRSPRVTAHEDEMSIEDLQRYVDSVSKGLAEVTSSSTVQFIHESVGDFLLGKSGRSDLLSSIDGFDIGNPGDIHERLRQNCLEHILVAYPVRRTYASRSGFIKNHPFVHYAVINILRHSDQAYCRGISQTAVLQEFPIHEWTELYNTLGNEENDVRSEIFQKMPSILYLLAKFNAHHLLRDHPELEKQFNVSCGGWRYPCMAAAWGGNIESLRYLANATAVSPSSHLTHREVSSMLSGMYRRGYGFNLDRVAYGGHEGDLTLVAHLTAFGHGPLLESFLVQVCSRDCECLANRKGTHTESKLCPTKARRLSNSHRTLNSDDHIRFPSKSRRTIFWARTAEVMGVLLAYGVDPNVRDYSGGTVVHSAARDSLDGIQRLEAICSVQQVKLKVPRSRCPLESPAMKNNSDPLLKLTAPRFDINIRDALGRTALSLAAGLGDFAAVQLLLDTFSDIDIYLQDKNFRSPLHQAMRGGHEETAKLLLSRYRVAESDFQHLSKPDKEGRTIVSYAAGVRYGVDILRLLLKRFPQLALDTPDRHGCTPLRWAMRGFLLGADHISMDCIKLLLATGQVNPFHADEHGLSPFAMAKQEPRHRISVADYIIRMVNRRDLILEIIQIAENKEVMGKFQLEDEDLRQIEDEIAQARELIEDLDRRMTRIETWEREGIKYDMRIDIDMINNPDFWKDKA